jgi:hypothetical protein
VIGVASFFPQTWLGILFPVSSPSNEHLRYVRSAVCHVHRGISTKMYDQIELPDSFTAASHGLGFLKSTDVQSSTSITSHSDLSDLVLGTLSYSSFSHYPCYPTKSVPDIAEDLSPHSLDAASSHSCDHSRRRWASSFCALPIMRFSFYDVNGPLSVSSNLISFGPPPRSDR